MKWKDLNLVFDKMLRSIQNVQNRILRYFQNEKPGVPDFSKKSYLRKTALFMKFKSLKSHNKKMKSKTNISKFFLLFHKNINWMVIFSRCSQ